MKEQRKIFNFESKLLLDLTLEKEGYLPESLGKVSSKWVWAVCRFCGDPHRIRYGFFNKAKSACHKQCKLKEQSTQSPFLKKEVQEKSKQTNLKRYGVEYASQNKEISSKISASKMTKESQEKTEKTNLEKYNVKNVFQNEDIKCKIHNTMQVKYNVDKPIQSQEIKEKVKNTCMMKYGVINPALSPEIKEQTKNTNLDRYGSEFPMQNQDILKKSSENYKISILENKNGHYNLINTLRSEPFWSLLAKGEKSLHEICDIFNINYQSVTSRLLSEEFVKRYYEVYKFPKQREQKLIYNLIRDLGLYCTINDRSVISPLEIDIYVPDLKFGIEYNGSFWHSEMFLSPKEAQKKHVYKTNECLKKGIRLFHIFEHDWILRKNQYLNFIRTIVGKNAIRLGARKCNISQEETSIEGKNFIENNHIQGYGYGTSRFFILNNSNVIVGCMTASKHHRQNVLGNPVVLNRLCFLDNYNVVGGSTKLFNEFKKWAKNQGYDRILSWSDNRWTQGNIYNVLGFTLTKEYGPDYFYYDANKKIYKSKQSQKKSNNNCPKEITERDWCYNNNLFRIWDCGKKLWQYNL